MMKKMSEFKKKVCVFGLAAATMTGGVIPAAVSVYAEETKTEKTQASTNDASAKKASKTEKNAEPVKEAEKEKAKKEEAKTEEVKKKEDSAQDDIKQGWVKEDGGFKYYGKDGKPYTGWHKMGKAEGETTSHWSYFDKNGTMYTGWHKMGKKEGEKTEHWSYFGGNGWLRTGWQKLGKADGEKTEHWSFFGSNGWLVTGWKYMDKSQGEKTPHWSFFGNNGWLVTGWKYMDKSQGEKTPHWSYFGNKGWLVTGWKYMDKSQGEKTPHWSYFGSNGWLRTGMVSLGKADGEKVAHKSFFGGNGWLVVNKEFTYNKVQYIADSKGWLTAVKSEHEKTLARAMQLVSKITNDNMTKEQKLRTCFNHIRDSYPEKNPRIPHYSGAGWHTLYANDIFVNKSGNCFSCCAAFAYMAKAIGFDNVYAISVNGHGWTEINGLVYDAERERWHKGSYYALSYNTPIGTQDALEQYQWIFSAKSPHAKVKI